MSNIIPSPYPLDYTGLATSNLIQNEPHVLASQQLRAIAPTYAPFFAKNVVIKDAATNTNLTTSQYKVITLITAPSAIADVGNEVYGLIVITDQSVSSNITITYQTVGGDYCVGFDSLAELLNNLLADNRPVNYNALDNLPANFPPITHEHTISGTVGWEVVATMLEQLKQTLMVGDSLKLNFVINYVSNYITNLNNKIATLAQAGNVFGNHINDPSAHAMSPSDVGLGNVQNYGTATLAQAIAGLASDLYCTVDQVLAVVKNQVNLGMDAHIARTDNPHNVTAAQVGLGNLQNYAPATLAQLRAPNSGTPHYVTDDIAGAYITERLAALNTSFTSLLATLQATVTSLSTTITGDNTSISNVNAQIQALQDSLSSPTNTANQALTVANTLNAAAGNSSTAAQALIQTYLTDALTRATAQAYAQGHADALAGH